VKAAFEANTGLSRHSSAEDIRERIERALQDFTGNAQRVSTIAHELALYRSRIEQRLDVKDSRTDRLLTPHLLSEADIDEVRNELLALSTIPAALINLSDQAEDYAGRFTNGLDRLSRDIRKLSEDVSATQTWQFVGWETIPSVAVFIAATIAAPRPDVMVKAIQSTMPWF
ncbi:hypothetical protein, partial [Brevundimonas sp.]|uniref:hypothetical protein n=1 Tax=Brevundimonas sp. TaxID=1871086 RepID=UPI00391A923B